MSKIPHRDRISETWGRADGEGVPGLRSIFENTNLEISPSLVSLLLGDVDSLYFLDHRLTESFAE